MKNKKRNAKTLSAEQMKKVKGQGLAASSIVSTGAAGATGVSPVRATSVR